MYLKIGRPECIWVFCLNLIDKLHVSFILIYMYDTDNYHLLEWYTDIIELSLFGEFVCLI